jgi:hypothetical protein
MEGLLRHISRHLLFFIACSSILIVLLLSLILSWNEVVEREGERKSMPNRPEGERERERREKFTRILHTL